MEPYAGLLEPYAGKLKFCCVEHYAFCSSTGDLLRDAIRLSFGVLLSGAKFWSYVGMLEPCVDKYSGLLEPCRGEPYAGLL